MKFQPRLGLLIFYIRFCELQKASGITPWKKCYSLLRWPCLLQDACSTDVYCSKQTGSSSVKGNHHPSFLRFWNWAEENQVDAAKICGGAENVVKTETRANIRKWIVSWFYYFRHLPTYGVLLTIIAWVAHRYGQIYHDLLINILLSSFQLFLHSDQPSLRGEIILSMVPASRGGCIIHAGGGGCHALTDRLLWCNRRRPAATSSRRASFSALASANLRVFCIERTSRWRICMSVIHAFASFSFGHFCRAGLCRY